MWLRIREAFGAESFSDFIPIDDCVVDNEQLTNEEVNATTEGHSQLPSDTDSDRKSEPQKVVLTSQEVRDRIEVKEYFQQQRDDLLQLRVAADQNPAQGFCIHTQ